ncbi:SoxR reducing system RseC family protein [Accumulibacter sp.]|uniref:SoxR reducing system RseC family protein n=1 Tax=Accumulibacter sp. TaxID=2053492 RepID=UPI0025EA64E9|nr:SoxR reducing system RseC family protein [Accumulibacter sp.]MCM8612778.1 SoxR reducing system RseC family protein [Accumulibacter sp.]MCM8637572.1 SoxR reducing system RseC family protein [Accumulibacter sp.]MCM8639711.1 SoxR reducing system RseC family protein [Accumulibacter sp.]
MNEAWGTVVALAGEQATIRIDETGCGRCRQPGGCGGSQAARLFCHTPRTFSVPNPDGRQVGERVQIVLAGGSLGRSALHAYVQPLLALLGGAFAGSAIAGEAGAIGGAIAGLSLGWLLLRRAQMRWRKEQGLQPSIRS